ncbi:hypothetical protein [Rhizobium ruizarguesonis]|uniref:hypothetical protein n=1 Tax=Rhizobium ruizarguesonis TaxID=2081791 RepID=UPI0010313858|nr:hypothetical protein [Rhizobium ruizarguesonis]TBE87765.1 hypothetical protein ELG99_13415 [Rhizobium ruizarguesonis]
MQSIVMRYIATILAVTLFAGTALADGWYSNERTVEKGIRTGTTPSGAEYRIMPDKSATVIKDGVIWVVGCKIDPINDNKNCETHDAFERVMVVFGTTERPTEICLPGHNFPGRTAFLRVDKNKAIETGEDGCVGGGFIAQMLKGKQLVSRIVVWPYDEFDDDKTDLSVLRDALDLARYVRKL